MPSKTNLLHRHKLIMNNIIGREDSKGTFHGGQNYNIVQGSYKQQKPIINKYILGASATTVAIAGLPRFYDKTIKPIWDKSLKQVWQNAAEEGETFINDLHVGEGTKTLVGYVNQEITDQYISEHGADKVTAITDTDREWLADMLRSGISDGKTQQEIASDIADAFDDMSIGRAGTIARTETSSAFNYASQETASDVLPDGSTKVWYTTSEKPRPWHEDVDGDEVPINEPFNVMDEDMMYPGDPNGSPENTINCLCVLSYNITSKVGEEEEE
jgi:hypothetical protein